MGVSLDGVGLVNVGLDSQCRLVRTAPSRNSEESIISQVFQDNILPQMDHPGN